jgi:hypothetical protein
LGIAWFVVSIFSPKILGVKMKNFQLLFDTCIIFIFLLTGLLLGEENISITSRDKSNHILSSVFDRIRAVSNEYKRNNFSFLMESFSEDGDDMFLDVIDIFSEKSPIILCFYKKNDYGRSIIANITLGYYENGNLANYYEENNKKNYYEIQAEIAADNNPKSLEMKLARHGSCKWLWSESKEIMCTGKPDLLQKINFSLSDKSKKNDKVNKVRQLVIKKPLVASNEINCIVKNIETIYSESISRSNTKIKELPLLKGENEMIRRDLYNKTEIINITLLGHNGYVLKMADGYVSDYYEGDIDFNDDTKMKDNEMFFVRKISPLNGKGIHVKFHTTGYPASYKTIVKNRLFGRQIEWNDKGEVISDLDIDIPKPWADAPKNVENSQQKK